MKRAATAPALEVAVHLRLRNRAGWNGRLLAPGAPAWRRVAWECPHLHLTREEARECATDQLERRNRR